MVALPWKVLPQRGDQRVLASLLERNGDDCELSFRILVDEVGHHVEALPIERLFRGMVEVELDELVTLATNRQEAARSVIHLNCMAVVHDVERRSPILKHKRRQAFGRHVLAMDVYRRLVTTRFTGAICGVELRPV